MAIVWRSYAESQDVSKWDYIMKIKVEVKNKLLGDSVFWEGDSKDIIQIKNKVARRLAEVTTARGGKHKFGMWLVSEVKESE